MIHTARSNRSSVALFFVALVALAVGCTRPPPRSQLDTARTVVTATEVALKLACDDASPLGRPPPLTLEAPEPTLEGVAQAVRSYVCSDALTALLAEARAILRRMAERDDTPSAPAPGARGDAGPPPTRESTAEAHDGGTVSPSALDEVSP